MTPLGEDLAMQRGIILQDRYKLTLEQPDPLRETFCSMDPAVMHGAAVLTVRFYREIARHLAHKYGMAVPTLNDPLLLPSAPKTLDLAFRASLARRHIQIPESLSITRIMDLDYRRR